MILGPAAVGARGAMPGPVGSRCGSVSAAILCAILWAGPAPGQERVSAGGSPIIQGVRVRGSHTSWSIGEGDSALTVRQTRLPLEIESRPDPRLRVKAGIELRSQSIGDTGSVSSTGLAGGWLDARFLAGSRWLIGAGGAVPFRDPSVTIEESRLVSWLQETGLQMGSGLALEPMIEGRLSRDARVSDLHTAAAGVAVTLRLPHAAYSDGATFDPGDRVRVALGLEGPVSGWRGSLAITGTAEGVSRLGGDDRYQEGPRLRLEAALLHPGNTEFRMDFGSLLQAEGEGAGGWPAPGAGTLWRTAAGLSWGSLWRWTARAAVWRTQGFDEMLGDSFAVRPGISLSRSVGAHRFEASISPLIGTAARDRSLRGIDAAVSWGIAR